MKQKEKSFNQNALVVLCSVISLCILFIFIVTALCLSLRLDRAQAQEERVVTLIKYVYKTDGSVSAGADEGGNTENGEETPRYFVREHSGVIGIFSSSGGDLLYTLETNIKTLPEKDRDLLREGFAIMGDDELRAVIEDYTG